MLRSILHVDMDAFFAAIEQRDDPALRGKPVLVGGTGPRGVVCAASYEARPFGCRSAQPMAVAQRCCPHAVIVPVRGRRYHEVSQQVFEILRGFTPLVEPLSVDEAFLDVTGSLRLLGDAPTIAKSIRQRIADELNLTASIGVAHNKFLAKLASDLNKPDGLTIVPHDDVAQWLAPLDVRRMWGVGPVTERKLEQLGIRTFGDLQQLDEALVARRFGSYGTRLLRLARGLDDRTVEPRHHSRSVSRERTFHHDLATINEARRELMLAAEDVARRLRRHRYTARTVTVKIRFGSYETITRNITLARPTDHTDDIWQAVRTAFERWAHGSFQPIRLLGVSAGQIIACDESPELFTHEIERRSQSVDRTTDSIIARFGRGAIARATTLNGPDAAS